MRCHNPRNAEDSGYVMHVFVFLEKVSSGHTCDFTRAKDACALFAY